MPTYSKECSACGTAGEYTATIAQRNRVPKCEICKGRCVKAIISAPAMFGDMNDFGLENHGKGRWNPQLQAHVTSVSDAKAKAAKRGWEIAGE